MNPHASHRTASAFTLVEVLIALAIGAMLAAAFVPQLLKTLSSSEQGTADNLQVMVQGVYENWATLGASHPASGSPELTLALLTLLGGEGSDVISATPAYTAVAGDSQAIRESRRSHPLPTTIRARLPAGMPMIETVGGAPEVVYGSQFLIRFSPTSTKTGNWSVSLVP